MNVREDLLIPLGWNAEVQDCLQRLVRSVPRQLDPDARVRVVAAEGEGDDPASTGRFPGNEAVADSTGEFVRHLPTSIADVWPRLLDLTFQFLGSQEARYRTGFYEEEINDALAAIRDIAG
ncbi:hypothetical protein [Nocardia barduliensis]|uniref:hypothetical protein n=1 Tax=Nocardia barduliensis TaxID=2736643 RepID=UPI001572142A|nr:hypothetical protein [Nocardia barduliensis]